MRWLFLLLLVLNVFYAGWHQQEVPQRPLEIQALSLYKGSQQDIRLLSEANPGAPSSSASARDCLYLGGVADRDQLAPLSQRLAEQGVRLQAQVINGDQGAIHWLRIDPQDRRLLDDSAVEALSQQFNGLKHQIMPCEGIATSE